MVLCWQSAVLLCGVVRVHADVPVRTEVGRSLKASELDQAASPPGFYVSAVHVRREGPNGLITHVRHPVETPSQKSSRRLQAAFPNQREKVLTLAALSLIAYREPWMYGAEAMQPIYDSGDSLYGAGVKDTQSEMQGNAAKIANLSVALQVDGGSNITTQLGGLDMDPHPLAGAGVCAMEYYKPGAGVVLAFRGTWTTGDTNNGMLWLADWWTTRLNQQLKAQWIDLAGFKMSQEMIDSSSDASVDSKSLIRGGLLIASKDFMVPLVQLAEENGVDKAKVEQTGYWEFTKIIVDASRSSLKLKDGEHFMLTGHSQGGARAALASMYLEKKYGSKYETITFAAIGGLCFPRHFLYTNGALTDDIDVYTVHAQVTDYVHPLDIYGNFDYDVGNVCLYGTTNLSTSKAKQYCEPVFMEPGADVTAAELMAGAGMPYKAELAAKFARCKYFTHWPFRIYEDLTNPTYLHEDGSTDGGCKMQTAIPKDDPRQMCPGDGAVDMSRIFGGCNEAKSCGTCMVTSSSYIGSACYWCEADLKCRAYSSTYLETCGSKWQKQCGTVNYASSCRVFSAILGLVYLQALWATMS